MQSEVQRRVLETQSAFAPTMTQQSVELAATSQALNVKSTQLSSALIEIYMAENTATQPPAPSQPILTEMVSTEIPLIPSLTPTPAPPQPSPTLGPESWKSMPVVPTGVSEKMRALYNLGQMMGNNPHAFSKVGDCNMMQPNFFSNFDEDLYNLGEYSNLLPVIQYFAGSFNRVSRAAKDGLSANAALAVLWNDWKDCGTMETPLDCELRIQRPSFAIISVGTNDANGFAPFETTLRRVIEVTIGHGVVPILATKADNVEGDDSINATIARIAYEYELPLWNFWLAVQPLPDHGLRSLEHLTYGDYVVVTDFSPENLQYAYNMRNLTALQVLDVVWKGVTGVRPAVSQLDSQQAP